MSKRARCPYCDELFRRDILDEHVMRCRQERRAPKGRTVRKVVIIDGSNVAYYLSTDGQPRLQNIVTASRSLVSVGFVPIVVVSAALIHQIDKEETLADMISKRQVLQAPKGTDDDLLIIKTAEKEAADIVSNDRFLDWVDRFPWLPSRLRRYRMSPSGLILV